MLQENNLSSEEIVKAIVQQLQDWNKESPKESWDKLENSLYALFFDIPNYDYLDASIDLRNVGVINKVGERDSYGPLSWGILTPDGWKYFG